MSEPGAVSLESLVADHRILVCVGSGGVGKTTTSVNLGYLASRYGWRTLLWDLDPQGAATYCFRVKPKQTGGVRGLLKDTERLRAQIRETDYEGLDVLRARFALRNLDIALSELKKPAARLTALVAPLADSYDLILFDCPPGITLSVEP